MNTKPTNEAFSELISKAKNGEAQALHRYLNKLYQDGKRSLLKLTRSEAEAEEYFAAAVAKFWDKFVHGDAALPESNVSGYIYTMAKFMCLDHKRTSAKQPMTTPLEPDIANRKELSESPGWENDLREAAQREKQQREAMQRAMSQLGENCRQLFRTMLETGLEKPRELFGRLGLQDARAVTVLRYECTKQLKVKAAVELELLMQEGH